MELFRRVALVLMTCLGVWLFWSVTATPLCSITAVDLQRAQRTLGGMLPSSEERTLRALPRPAFLARSLASAVRPENAACAAFIRHAALASLDGGGALRDRVGSRDRSATPCIVYSVAALPPGCLTALAQARGSVPVVTGDAAVPLAKVRLFPVTPDAFHLGSGYIEYPAPPSWLLHPHRRTAWLLLAVGLMIYGVLPRAKRQPGEVRYATGRVVVGDLLGLMLFALFFALPLGIAGGAQPALANALPLVVILWTLAGFGLLILALGAQHAAFSLRVEAAGLRLGGLLGGRTLPLATLCHVGVETQRPARWLRTGLWLSALLTGSPTAAGMALLQASAAPLRLVIQGQDGSSVGVWLTDNLGTPLLAGVDGIVRSLAQAGVPGAEETLRHWFTPAA